MIKISQLKTVLGQYYILISETVKHSVCREMILSLSGHHLLCFYLFVFESIFLFDRPKFNCTGTDTAWKTNAQMDGISVKYCRALSPCGHRYTLVTKLPAVPGALLPYLSTCLSCSFHVVLFRSLLAPFIFEFVTSSSGAFSDHFESEFACLCKT